MIVHINVVPFSFPDSASQSGGGVRSSGEAGHHVDFVSVDLADKVKRRWIGVMIQDVMPELAEAIGITRLKGALVADVTPDSPADEAGIVAGDSIVRFDGGKVSKVSDLVSLVADATVGKAVILELIRSQTSVEIVLRVGEWPEGKE